MLSNTKPWFYNWAFLEDSKNKIRGKVIDIGCGSAKYRPQILKIPQVTGFTGLDFIKNSHVDITANLNKKLPLKSSSYDTAICISVMEHLLEPESALKEIHRILKPGSYLLISTPWIFPYHAVPNDYFRFSRSALEYLLEKSGFEVVSLSSSGGRLRIISTFFTQWFPFFSKIAPYFDLLLNFLDTKEKNERNIILDTHSHKVVALRK